MYWRNMHVLINSYTTYEAMSTYFVHNAFVDGAISSSLVLCVQLTIVSITKSQPCLALCTMLDLLTFWNISMVIKISLSTGYIFVIFVAEHQCRQAEWSKINADFIGR